MVDTSEVAISHLQRRKIEGRVLIPFIQVLRDRFGQSAMREVVDETIRRLAAEDGARWAAAYGKSTASLRTVAQELWAGGGGMDVTVVAESEDHLDFNVTRCQYAEFYKELGLADLGARVHCNRDHAMLAGFNDELELSRSQTIMEGGACCDFRFRKGPQG
ncbi:MULTISPECIES: L-2-amino-thiazoline-4-carboxylic acid hydrolase [unclassified Bradyrhizobium]|uniref:L-2-amino-thiazoline-4-carboxylic acid hydrolase n=1 Tax=unclassified Bradyrhizobium TaxID=2631580 RepID=UPI000414DA9F|nr:MULTISPECIES: L-2-amino-thiazoline-4-carboxylic acid hydrolase [unclassified Bradyrhizobium]MCP3458834.1 L-2-amino-thiazoline-4-carboxylic acid hydrolase [Bradyrhizobium sp. CCGUVB23]